VTSEQMRALARLSASTARDAPYTNDQNLILPWFPRRRFRRLHAALVAIDLAGPTRRPSTTSSPAPAWTTARSRSRGRWGCRAAPRSPHSHPESRNGFAERLGPFAVKISGCPNSCGQHHIGDIGLTGHLAKTADGSERPFYSILVGGAVGEETGRIGKRIGRFAEKQAPAVIAALARFYERERQPDEKLPCLRRPCRCGPPPGRRGRRPLEASPA